ncbi:ParA family protein [Methylocapsa acidiphila]|uniref:ParA family protein n=1 Tax=Methylocapsa acidiphila TaxID=133552 RepID=UPI0003F8A872|nr:ParA family protein [Methylocapsa acidiphila]
MAGKMIAIANMKGGVGKTTTVVSLAEALAADDPTASILVVDLDPQASASACLAGDGLLATMIEEGRTIDAFLALRLITREPARLAPRIRHAVSRTTHKGDPLKISFLPCGPHLRLVEREIIYNLTEREYSMRAIEGQTWKLFEQEFLPLKEAYTYVIFDCPPGISPLTEIAIRASDLVIVPTIPDRVSILGLDAFCQIIWKEPPGVLPKPRLLPHVLVTRWQKNVKQHQDILAQLKVEAKAKDPGICLLNTRVQQAAALAGALANDGAPTFKQKYGEVISVLDQLVQELKGVLRVN